MISVSITSSQPEDMQPRGHTTFFFGRTSHASHSPSLDHTTAGFSRDPPGRTSVRPLRPLERVATSHGVSFENHAQRWREGKRLEETLGRMGEREARRDRGPAPPPKHAFQLPSRHTSSHQPGRDRDSFKALRAPSRILCPPLVPTGPKATCLLPSERADEHLECSGRSGRQTTGVNGAEPLVSAWAACGTMVCRTFVSPVPRVA